MPFEDEVQVVDLAPWSSNWASEFETLAAQLRAALGGIALAIQHIGSTAVPELLAKDVIDVQVLVHEIRNRGIETAFVRSGFRRRPEPWNQVDLIGGTEFAKTVYAPPPGARPANFGAPLALGVQPARVNRPLKISAEDLVVDLERTHAIRCNASQPDVSEVTR